MPMERFKIQMLLMYVHERVVPMRLTVRFARRIAQPKIMLMMFIPEMPVLPPPYSG
jgi:hypothetical protein